MSISIEERADELAEEFGFFDDRADQIEYLIDLGKRLPPLAEELKTDDNLVHGCASQVWVTAQVEDAEPSPILRFQADSNSKLTRGIIGLLHRLYDGQPPRAILDYDINPLMMRLSLDQWVTMGRRNGLAGMVVRIKTLAAQNG